MGDREHCSRPVSESRACWPSLPNTGVVRITSVRKSPSGGGALFQVVISERKLDVLLLAEYDFDEQAWLVTNGFQRIPQHYWSYVAELIGKISPFSLD